MVWCRNISRGRLFLVVIRREGVGCMLESSFDNEADEDGFL